MAEVYGRAEPRSVKGLVVALCSWCDGIIFCVVAYLWGQKVFRGFRIYGSKGFHIFGVLIQKVFVSFRSERFCILRIQKVFVSFFPPNLSLEFWRETA